MLGGSRAVLRDRGIKMAACGSSSQTRTGKPLMYAEQSSRRSGRRVRSTSWNGQDAGSSCEPSASDAIDDARLPFADDWREYGGVTESGGTLLNVSLIISSPDSVDGSSRLTDAALGWFLGTPTPPTCRMRMITFGCVATAAWSSTRAPT